MIHAHTAIKRTITFALLAIAILVAVNVPILFAIYQAQKLGIASVEERAISNAKEVLLRSVQIKTQIDAAIDQLAADKSQPCSGQHLAMMAEIALKSSRLKAVGHVSDDRLKCSSIGRHDPHIPLDPINFAITGGLKIRPHIEIPSAKGQRFVAFERDGFIAIIHKEHPFEITSAHEDISFAVFSQSRHTILESWGNFKHFDLKSLDTAMDVKFKDGDQTIGIATITMHDTGPVVVAKSNAVDVGVIVEVPTAQVAAKTRWLTMILVPIGIVLGLILSWGIIHFARRQMSLPMEIKSALRHKDFYLVYQPVVDLQTGAWIGAEALLRWENRAGKIIRPDVFVRVAEEEGLINDLTRQVFEMIAADAPEIFTVAPDFHIAINLSAEDLNNPGTIQDLKNLVTATNARPQQFIIEATESGFITAETARQVIREARDYGVNVAIDDFGTGYSGLAYLEKLELNYLKIDKSFIDTIGTDAATGQVIFHIIEMAQSLRLRMIAEGVETEAQANVLRERGVEYAQGYHFARPMPLTELVQQLPQRRFSIPLS